MKNREKDAKRVKRQYRQEVADFINKVRRNLEINGVIDRTMTAQLDILAINLQLYLDAYDKVKEDGLFITNVRYHVHNHTAVYVISKASPQVAVLS